MTARDRGDRTVRSRIHRARTVRSRIVQAASAVVAAALLVAGGVIVLLVRSSLERPMRGEARVRAAEVVAAIDSSGVTATIGPFSAPWPTLAQVLDAEGKVLAASAELQGRGPLLSISADGREPTGSASLRANGRQQRWRLDSVVATAGGRPVTVVVATSLTQIDRSVALLLIALAATVPALTALVGLLSWWLAGRALRPVEAMRREVASFDRRPAGRRVAAPATDDEIGRLGRTLNSLLDRLDAANDAQRRFVADASHELRSPVANIRTALEIALAHPATTSWPDLASDVLAQDERMGRLVEDLLLLARAESGAVARQDRPVDLVAVVIDVRDARAAPPVPVRIEAPEPVVVHGDAGQLERLVDNLVGNAVRHAASAVSVSVVRQGAWAELAVRDDGPGVATADRDRIFDRFVRLDADRSPRGGGAGLGLAIVAEVAAAHGGTVTVGDGRPGAVFTVRLPIRAMEGAGARSQAPLRSPSVGSAP